MMGTTDQLQAGARIGDYVVDGALVARPGLIACAATHALLPRRARIVCLHPAFVGVQAPAMQLMREACILEALRHPGVPRVYECGLLVDRRPWVAIELIEGPTLADGLAGGAALPAHGVLGMLADVGEILHHAHARGLVHRNLRPEVISMRPEGPCINDWSSARGLDPAQPVPEPGAPRYQAPEVLGGELADSSADVFALGAVAREAMAPGAIPPRLATLIARMLAPDPMVRPTAAEVRAEAMWVIEQLEMPAPPAPPEEAADVEVQVEDVELAIELAAGTEPDVELVALPPRELRVRWTPPDLYQQRPLHVAERAKSPTEPMPMPSTLPPPVTRAASESESVPVLIPEERSSRRLLPSRILEPVERGDRDRKSP